jgi:nucleotide-binding universal stress UspA family protein
MQPFKHILIATDFEEPAERAQNLALALATSWEARLTLLHVFPNPTVAYGGSYWRMTELEREAQKALDTVAATLRERFPKLETAFRSGLPWQEIVTAATDVSADLIVVGTHGRRGLSHALLGSVAERVVRVSPVPVLTVSHRAAPTAASP